MCPGIKSCRRHCPVVICRRRGRPTGPWAIAFSRTVRSLLHPAQSFDRVPGQGPAWDRRRAGQGPGQPGGEAIRHGPVTEPVALLDAGTGADHRLGPDHAAVAHDRAGFDDAAAYLDSARIYPAGWIGDYRCPSACPPSLAWRRRAGQEAATGTRWPKVKLAELQAQADVVSAGIARGLLDHQTFDKVMGALSGMVKQLQSVSDDEPAAELASGVDRDGQRVSDRRTRDDVRVAAEGV